MNAIGASRRIIPVRRLVPLLLAATACQPDSRERPVECIAPANAGGGWDLTCRAVGRVMSQLDLVTGTVRVTNMPGAGGGVAFAHVVTRRTGDPSVLVAASPATTLRLAQRQYGPLHERQVRWVGALAAEYGVLAVRHDAPWHTLDELIAAWRAEPGSVVTAGVSAVAGQDHVKVMLLARAAGIDPRHIRYVPFDGGGEALSALLGGFIHVFTGDASEIGGQVEAGRVRPLTVFAPQRLSGPLADVPTSGEFGYPVEWVTWRGFYVPAEVGAETYEGWVSRLATVAASPEWERVRITYRLEPFVMLGAEFEAFVQRQVDTLRVLSREIGLLR